MVDEGWPGNNERGLPVEWYGSLGKCHFLSGGGPLEIFQVL